jgi:hypothetical protein
MRNATTLFNTVRADLGLTANHNWGPDLEARDVARHLLILNITRKFEGDEPVSKAATSAAIAKFMQANQASRDFVMMGNVNTSIDELLVGEFESSLQRFFSRSIDNAIISDSYLDHFGLGMPGPGASNGTKNTDFLHKMFGEPVTLTSGLAAIWAACTTSETYDAINSAFFLAEREHGIKVVAGSKVSVVPKTYDVGRTIASEPSANMWMQRGLSVQLEKAVSWYFGFDLSNQQDKNRLLAQWGSIRDDLVTIDLESASDRISLSLLERFPSWFRVIVERYRSPVCEMPDGSTVKLDMISTMGNGFTFSLMTLIMSCVVDAVARLSGIKLTRWRHAHASDLDGDKLPLVPGNWGVFGDDIICPSEIYLRVVRLLELLNFKVNDSKSFVKGKFRESCGGDFFAGEDVRPVFIKHLETRADLFVAFNSLSRWSALHGVLLGRTLRLLLKWIGDTSKVIPLHCNDDQGIKVPKRFLGSHPNLDENGSIRYNCYIPVSVTIEIQTCELDHATRRRLSPVRNRWAISQLFVAGVIRGGSVTIRQKDRKSIRYRTTPMVSPCWDHVGRRAGRFSPVPEHLMDVLELAFF